MPRSNVAMARNSVAMTRNSVAMTRSNFELTCVGRRRLDARVHAEGGAA